MTASDDKLIRLSDAIAALTEVAVRFGITGEPQIMILAKDALRTIPAVQVAVKPLEWEDRDGVSYLQANCVFGQYQVSWLSEFECWQLYTPKSDSAWRDCFTRHSHKEAAKAAAQADYDARIRSALTAQPSPGVAELVALLAEARTDLSAYVDAACPKHQRSFFPVVQEKWERDMELCWQIDAALARGKGGAA